MSNPPVLVGKEAAEYIKEHGGVEAYAAECECGRPQHLCSTADESETHGDRDDRREQ